MTSLRRQGVVYRPLEEPTPTIPLCAVWHENDPAPEIAGFIAALREVADPRS